MWFEVLVLSQLTHNDSNTKLEPYIENAEKSISLTVGFALYKIWHVMIPDVT